MLDETTRPRLPRRPRDLTPEELREASDALAEEYAEADRIAAPLMALQDLEAALDGRGLLDRAKGEMAELVDEDGAFVLRIVQPPEVLDPSAPDADR